MIRRIVLTSAFAFVIVAGLFPILTMVLRSLTPEGRFSLLSYQGLLSSHREWILLGHTVALSLSAALLTTIIGVPLGVLLGKTDLPLRRFFTVAFTIPLLIPPYITAVGWADFLGTNGLLAVIAGTSTAKAVYDSLFGLPGCVFVLVSTFLPIVVLLTMTSLKTVDPRLEEAGRLVAGWRSVLRRVTIPLIIPTISLGAVLVFLLAVGEFGVPNFLRYDVFAVESFVQFSAFYNFEAATSAAVPLAVITSVVLLLEWLFFRERIHQVQTISGRTELFPISLGKFRMWLFSLVALLNFFLVIFPLFVLIARSSSVSVYTAAVNVASESLLRSFLYAVLGASLLTVIGFIVGYLIHHQSMPFWRMTDTLTIFLFALPSTVIGIGLISMWNRPWTNFIYGSFAVIVLGYVVKYTALTSRITASMLMLIPFSMEEAGQVAGLSWMQRMRTIVTPMARRGILVSWLVGYIFCLRDLETTMIVYPPGHDTLPVRIATLMANGSAELIAALCVLMVGVTVLPPVFLWMVVAHETRM